MKVLVVCDSFKGSISSMDAGENIRRGILAAHPDAQVEVMSAADGGEGMARSVLINGTGHECTCRVTHTDGVRHIGTTYTYDTETATAYIDIAAASGLTLLGSEDKNPMKTTTFGTGEMIATAVTQGARHICLGLGGSATNDAGLGALQALGVNFFDEHGTKFCAPLTGTHLAAIASIDAGEMMQRYADVRFTLLCDVNNPFSGPHGAVAVFAAQKGADADMRQELERGMTHIAAIMKKSGFPDVFSFPGSGAAGGAGGGLAAVTGGEIVPGAQTVLALAGIDRRLNGCDLVITGEGKADAQTLMGKLPATVLRVAQERGTPVWLLCGKFSDEQALLQAGFAAVTDINRGYDTSIDTSMRHDTAAMRLRLTARDNIDNIINSHKI